MNATNTLMRTRNMTLGSIAIAKYDRLFNEQLWRMVVLSVAMAYNMTPEEAEMYTSDAHHLLVSILTLAQIKCGMPYGTAEVSQRYRDVTDALIACPFLGHPVLTFLNLFTQE